MSLNIIKQKMGVPADEKPKQFRPESFALSELSEENLIDQGALERLNGIKERLRGEEFAFLRGLKEKFGTTIDICLVGGIVRDAVLGEEAKDYDFLVSFSPVAFRSHEEARKAFEDFFRAHDFGKLVLAGRNFGVYKLSVGGEIGTVDIAFPRNEAALDNSGRGGRTNFDVQSNALMPAEDDLKRRDLDINAMALRIYDFKENDEAQFIDLFGGLNSIRERRIRAVGDPEAVMRDDYSRIFRAIRFAAKYGFEIEENTWQAITGIVRAGGINATETVEHIDPGTRKNKTSELFLLKRETMNTELGKAFSYDPLATLRLLRRPISKDGRETCILEEVMPDLFEERRLSPADKKYLYDNQMDWYIDKFGDLAKPGEMMLKNKPDNKSTYRDYFQRRKTIKDGDILKTIHEPKAAEMAQSRTIKKEALDRAEAMLVLASDENTKLSLEEIYAALFHNSGQTSRLAEPVRGATAVRYPRDKVLSRVLFGRTHEALRLAALMDGAEKYALSQKNTDRIITGLGGVYGLLNNPEWDEDGKVNSELVRKIIELMPQGTDDELFRVLDLDIRATTDITDKTRERFEKLRVFLQNDLKALTERFGDIDEGFGRTFNTRQLQDIFRLKQSPLYREVERLAKAEYISYLRETTDKNEEFLPIRAQDRIFEAITEYDAVRAEWKNFVTPTLYDNIFRPHWHSPRKKTQETFSDQDRIAGEKRFEREILALAQKSAYRRFSGRPIEEFTGSAATEKRFRRRGRGRDFSRFFREKLRRDPAGAEAAILADMQTRDKGRFVEGGEIVSAADKQPKKNKATAKFFDIILPEITEQYGVEQPAEFHSEGDVFQHTFLALKEMKGLADEGALEADDELAAAILLHDAEKPAAMRLKKDSDRPLFSGHENIERKKIDNVLYVLDIDPGRADNIERAINNHMLLLNKWRSRDLLGKEPDKELTGEIYELFPDGSHDLLYKLMLCDARASLDRNGRSHYENGREKFDILKQNLLAIDTIKEQGLDFTGFMNQENIVFFLVGAKDKAAGFALFRKYADFLTTAGEKDSAVNLGKFIQQEIAADSEAAIRFLNRKNNLVTQAAAILATGGGRGHARSLAKEFLKEKITTDPAIVRRALRLNLKNEFRAWLDKNAR